MTIKSCLNKVYHYEVRGIPFSWFKSYLTDRTQQTEVLGTKSTNINKLTSSVPQRSILGPILFIIYVNDFPKCLRYSSCLAFADDTTILISEKNQKNLYNNANEELNNIDNWLMTNKLSLNIDKTKCMHFKTLNTPTPNLTLFSSSFFELLTPQRPGFRSPPNQRFITSKLLKLSS